MCIVIAHVQSCQKNLLACSPGKRPSCKWTGSGLSPAGSKSAELLWRQRIGCARITEAHVPRIFGEHGAHVFLLHLLREHRSVEVRETVLDENRNVHACWQHDSAIVRCLHATTARESVYEKFLRTVCVDHPEPDREHELGRLIFHLDRPQHRVSEFRLLGQIYPRDEKFHVLPDIAHEHVRCARRDAVVVLPKPRFEPRALARRENEDIVFADRVLCFHCHAQAASTRTVSRTCNGSGSEGLHSE